MGLTIAGRDGPGDRARVLSSDDEDIEATR
jgi:hypothetical protein